MLDPSCFKKLEAMELSEDDTLIAEYLRMRENMLNVIKMMIRRKKYLDEQQQKEWPPNQFEEKVILAETYLLAYLARTEPFHKDTRDGLDFRFYWKTYAMGSPLKALAPKICSIACTISDTERAHKIYASIHTAERNRLDEDRADRLSVAAISRKEESSPKS